MSIQVLPKERLSGTRQATEAKKYRIAVFHNIPSGGARRAIYDYMKVLAEDGHVFDVFDYTTSNNGILPLQQFARNVFHHQFNPDVECKIRLPLISGYIEVVRNIRQFRMAKQIAKQIAARIDNGGYDVAFLHHCTVSQAPYLLRYLKTPSVFYSGDPPRGLYEPSIKREYESEARSPLLWMRDLWYRPVNAVGRRLHQTVLRREYEKNMEYVDVLMANSYYSLETFYKLHGIRARVIHPGIDAETFRPMDIKKEDIVLSVGGIELIKGHDFVIKACARVHQSLRPELYIIANRGHNDERKYLISLARELGVNLVFENNVSEDNLIKLYNRAKITLCGAVMEPFGLTPIESMACGTPVVAVREGGLRESVAHGRVGYLSDRDPMNFGRYIEELLVDDSLRESMARNAREHVLNYWTVGRARGELLRLFEYAINRHEQ